MFVITAKAKTVKDSNKYDGVGVWTDGIGIYSDNDEFCAYRLVDGVWYRVTIEKLKGNHEQP